MKSVDMLIPGRQIRIFQPSGFTDTQTTTAVRYLVEPGISRTRGKPFRKPNSWSWSVNYQETWSFSDYLTVHFGTSSFAIQNSGNIAGADSTKEPLNDGRDACYNQALNRLNDQVRGGLDLGVTLLESGSTKRMIQSVGKVISAARKARTLGGLSSRRPRRGQKPGELGSTRDIANGWLQWQYGWRQLLQDVFNAADESIRVVTSKLQSVRGSASRPIGTHYGYQRDMLGFRWNVDGHQEGRNACKITVILDVPNFDPARWTSMNPISLGWELIPYSFVVDWFIDVGSTLRNIETGLLYNNSFVEGYVSELFISHTYETISGSGIPISDPSTSTQLQGTITAYWLRKTFGRSLLSSYPLPRPPSFKVDMGAQRCFSAAALLRQLLK
jgi:hypothetical protein